MIIGKNKSGPDTMKRRIFTIIHTIVSKNLHIHKQIHVMLFLKLQHYLFKPTYGLFYQAFSWAIPGKFWLII